MNKYVTAAYLFGVSGGILCVMALMVMEFLGKEPISFTEVFGYFIIPLFVFIGIKHFKDGFNGGELSFGQGMTVGFFVYSILALISGIAIFIFLNMHPEAFEAYKDLNLALLEEKREVLIGQLDQKSFDTTYDNIFHMTIVDVAINDFLRKVIPGLFFTIIISIFLKELKKDKDGIRSESLSSSN